MELRHNELSTYGIGADMSPADWENVFRQLLHLGYLRQDFSSYGILKLSPTARPVLKGKTAVILGRPRNPIQTVEKVKKSAGGRKDYDQALFDALRAKRKEIANAAAIPPFVVFSDATLAEMARVVPTHTDQLHRISGVGEHKLLKYGKAFLEVITGYVSNCGFATIKSTDNDLRPDMSHKAHEYC